MPIDTRHGVKSRSPAETLPIKSCRQSIASRSACYTRKGGKRVVIPLAPPTA
jgi:hypothetical protein